MTGRKRNQSTGACTLGVFVCLQHVISKEQLFWLYMSYSEHRCNFSGALSNLSFFSKPKSSSKANICTKGILSYFVQHVCAGKKQQCTCRQGASWMEQSALLPVPGPFIPTSAYRNPGTNRGQGDDCSSFFKPSRGKIGSFSQTRAPEECGLSRAPQNQCAEPMCFHLGFHLHKCLVFASSLEETNLTSRLKCRTQK